MRHYPDNQTARRIARRIFRRAVAGRVSMRVFLAALTDVQRRYVEEAVKSRREGLSFGDGFDWNSEGRAVLPARLSVSQLEIPPEIRSALAMLGYEITDYREGKAIKSGDIKDGKRPVVKKIGKILEHEVRDQELLKKFKKRLVTAPKKTGRYQIVVTHNPEDVAGMSTNRDWVSCMTLPHGDARPGDKANGTRLNGGQYYATALRQVQYGGMCAYLVEEGDAKVERPLARIALKRMENAAGDFIYEMEPRVYGDTELAHDCRFQDEVKKAVENSNRTTSQGHGGLYSSADDASYSDGGELREQFRKSVVHSDEDALSLPPEDFIFHARNAVSNPDEIRRLFVKYALNLPEGKRRSFIARFLAEVDFTMREEDVEPLADWIDWSWVSLHVVMSEDFLKRHASRIDWRIVSLDGHHYPPEMLEQFRADPALRKDIDEFSDLPEGEDLYMAIRNWMQDFGAEYPLATKNPDGSFEVETEHSASEVQDECFMLEEGDSFSTMLSFRAPVKAPLLLDCDLSDAPVLYNKLRQYEFGAAKDFIDDNGLDMTVGEFLGEYIVGHEDEDDDIARDWKSHLDDWYDDWVDCRCDVSLIVQPKGLPGICELKTTVYLEYGDASRSVITDWLFESDTVCSSKRDFMENGRRAVYAALGALPENFK